MTEEQSARCWTAEQLDAIRSRGCNLLVAASAGTGKTAVLVERIIEGLTRGDNPLEVDRLLVVTFTEAAAAEMRERIARALKDRLKQNPQDSRLRRQLALLYKASISTIHSFCLDVIRMFFYRLDIDPAFRVASETESLLLQQEVMEELFEEYYSSRGGALFADLVECYGGTKGDEGLQERVKTLFDYARSHPWPEKWLRDSVYLFHVPEGVPIDDLPWTGVVKDHLALEVEGAIQMLDQARRLASRPGGPGRYLDNLEEDFFMLQELAGACREDGWVPLREKWRGINFSSLKGIKKGEADPDLQARVKELREKVKDVIKKCSGTFFNRTPEEFIDELRRLAPLMEALVNLVIDFGRKYREAKNARGLMDFSDLEHYCLELLLSPSSEPGRPVPSDIAIELQKKFDEVMVDEYQDTNAVQNTILHLVSRQETDHPNLFAVGDVKQSIYRFRLAEPTLFLEKYNAYSPKKGAANYRVNLSVNFRCRQEVIDAVNFLFRQILTPRVGEISYNKKAELYPGASYPEPPGSQKVGGNVEFHIIEIEKGEKERAEGREKENSEEPVEELETLETEARVVAQRIRRMVEGTADDPEAEFWVWDVDREVYRPVSYRDIVVLMRATKERAGTFMEVFGQWGIPVYAELGTGYFEAVEVNTALCLLKVVDNPRQDIPLAAVLRSPIVGLSDAELARIRLCHREGDFYAAVKAAAVCKELGETAGKLKKFLHSLHNWRTAARRAPLADLVWQIFRETGYFDYVGGLPGGGQRQANLRALYDRARQFDQFDTPGLFRFIRFIERIQETKGDLGTARVLGENENVVRLMSIHKSKGLEFPVVIVANLGKNFNLQDAQQELLLHRQYGLGPKFTDLERRIKYPTLPHLAIKQVTRAEAMAEELRILYVALTRARERLILVGAVRGLGRKCAEWAEVMEHVGWPLPDSCLVRARNYLDWIGRAVIRHRQAVPLRRAGGIEENPTDDAVAGDPSNWTVVVWGRDGKPLPAGEENDRQEPVWDKIRLLQPMEGGNPEAEQEIKRRLRWVYPYEVLRGKAAKVSVSEAKRLFDTPETAEEPAFSTYQYMYVKKPAFLQEKKDLSPAERGSVIHQIIQFLDLEKKMDEEGIQEQVREMIQRQIIDPEQVKAVNLKPLSAFFDSPLGQRLLLQPQAVRREVPFSLSIPAEDVYPDLPREAARGEKVLLQGVIDCFVDEGDGFLLIDFKTDREESETMRNPIVAYGNQIQFYARALSNIYNHPVKEAYLYFLMAGKAVEVPLKRK